MWVGVVDETDLINSNSTLRHIYQLIFRVFWRIGCSAGMNLPLYEP